MAVDHKLLFLVVVFGILMPLGKEGTYKYLRSELSCDFSLRAEPFSKKKKKFKDHISIFLMILF